MPPRRGKRVDLDVWGPPPPLPASSTRGAVPGAGTGGAGSAPGSSSAFLQHFARRTEVVGKDGAQGQLGVAVVPASLNGAAGAAHLKQSVTTPRPTSSKSCNQTPNTALSRSAAPAQPAVAIVQSGAKKEARIRIVAPSERACLPSRMLPQENRPTSSSSAVVHHGSRASQPSFPVACAADKAVRCIVAPSAAAAAAAASSCPPRGDSKGEACSHPLWPLRGGTGVRQCPSTASSVSTPKRSPCMRSPSKVSGASLARPTVSMLSERDERLSLPRSDQPIAPLRNLEGPLPAAAAAAAYAGHQNLESMKDLAQQASRLDSDRCQHSRSPETAISTTGSNKPKTYKPYSLNSYKALMADVAAQKPGGLGPSDTDEQRAAREKRERAKEYAKHAMKVARAALAAAGSCTDEGEVHPGTIDISPISSSARAARRQSSSSPLSSSLEASTTSTSTTTTSTLTSRSASAEFPAYRRQPQRGAVRATPSPQAIPPQHAKWAPSSSATPPPQPSSADVDGGKHTPSRSGAGSTNTRSPRAVLPPLSAPPRTTPTVAAFAVAAAPRRKVIQARRRRERAMTYAREVSQKLRPPTPAESEGGDVTCAASRGTKSRTRQVMKSGAAGDTEKDEMLLDKAAFISCSAFGGADVRDVDRAQRMQRLLELEALHTKNRETVEGIRRKLRA
ncbi:hypothetical protein, conserved [Leishmania tarentolae]|uniref:Uncharacterized protein n=1 Tax=Leishmania tarentolae TaxID=5689 RepID=A0A640KAM7_LEITA|nr:hypothetical protein, conserved [Leishmania tarentolae]